MLENLLNKPEAYRKKIAMASTGVMFLAIFFSWVSYRGLLSPNPQLAQNLQQTAAVNNANTVEQEKVELPRSQTPSDSAWDILKKEFGLIKKSVASVFVPFITGIEVYNNK